jgi:hypothetical protein
MQSIVQKKLGLAGSNTNDESKETQGKDKVVVHIQRGDFSPCLSSHRSNYLANSYYLAVLRTYVIEPADIDVYSQSDSFESFNDFDNLTRLKLDKSMSMMWKALVSADVVVLSKSAFSFVPALLNPKARVLYASFEEKPLPAWTKVDKSFLDVSTSFVESHQDRKSCSAVSIKDTSSTDTTSTGAKDTKEAVSSPEIDHDNQAAVYSPVLHGGSGEVIHDMLVRLLT